MQLKVYTNPKSLESQIANNFHVKIYWNFHLFHLISLSQTLSLCLRTLLLGLPQIYHTAKVFKSLSMYVFNAKDLRMHMVLDDEHLKLSEGSTEVYFVGRIKSQVGRASREVAPNNVYDFAWLIENKIEMIPNVKLIQEFSVIDNCKFYGWNDHSDVVSIGPSNKSMGYTVDVILNGVEIMKMNRACWYFASFDYYLQEEG
ncbi:hypothetical protein PTKIN_Ptkin05aG0096000 [Pterospermum kingtungense]